MSALVWIAAVIVLVIGELVTGDLVLLMLGGGALAAAGVDYFFGAPIWVDGVVFAVVSILLLTTVRPVAKRHLLTRPTYRTNIEALEGRHATVTTRVDEHAGRVKIGGDEWSARAMTPGEVFEPGDEVTVVEIDGATAVVWKT
ncbi:NfeD family protein [Gordonia desulfuricans]|uniref:NfeD family protein n=1 Tax=Gordonia desulfuricans TaxID=89051 RepID=A0A7K3LQK7_9ACTN|nr:MULTISPECIES: NfeD family protein [Gordonia]KOY49623.1 membrane protein [Gordonia sp. NB41Y]NDK90542.1 NfeD family protein [Gordonia desulfuricans]WLP90919.1 NfeD family protein [Gordonia sp. NB41Y]